MPRGKCANRGLKCKWPQLEKDLAEWIKEQRQSRLIVTRNAIRIHAIQIAKEQKIDAFRGTIAWCGKFMRCNGLCLQVKTKIAQKLPEDLEEKITNFQRYIIRIRMRNNYDLVNIRNMDETPVWLDMPSNKTVHTAGTKTVQVRTTCHEKSRFTVVLACMADGIKLKPMVIFKRKTMPKNLKFPTRMSRKKVGWTKQE